MTKTETYSHYQLRIGKNGLSRPFFYRPKTSDEVVFKEIIGGEKYNLRHLRRAEELYQMLGRRRGTGKRPLVVDAGAYIGASSIAFAYYVPGSAVVAIEPERGNFELLRRNVEHLPIQPIRAAVSSTAGFARIDDPGEGHWGYRAEPINGNMRSTETTPRVTINDIYAQHSGFCYPFIVKVDIEGGEADLFSANTEWVARTPLLIVELHDWLLTRSANSRSFLRCISQLDRDFVYVGEDVYSISNEIA